MKTALIQQRFCGNKADTINKTVSKIEEASQNGADLVVLQELHQIEYLIIGFLYGILQQFKK